MHIIPVIDLLNGVVVHAKKGIRTQYLPIQSSLTDSSQPLDIVKAFMDLYPFKTLYVADLNAIQALDNTGRCHHLILEEIHQAFPALTIWVDAAINHLDSAKKWSMSYVQLILGSESFSSMPQYQSLTSDLSNERNNAFKLSIDFSSQGYTGPKALLEDAQYWPQEVIAMTLAQVGANAGVDVTTIKNIISKSKNHHIYAAGGIRHLADLLQLQQLNIKGALVASALHNQQLTSKDLAKL